jgi:hypothetical protein
VTESKDGPETGDVAEEAVKLLGALQDWAKQARSEYAEAAGATAANVADALHDANEHIATGGRDCTYCPVCQAISLVRGTSPEVKQHLATAGTALLQAAAGLLATTVPDPDGKPDARGPIEHIDLTEPADWEDD